MNIYYEEKRKFFEEGHSLDLDFRVNQLKKLKAAIKKHESEILFTLEKDLAKPNFEAYTSEIGVVYKELDSAIKNLKKWARPEKVSTPLYLQPGKSYIYPQAKGIVLIISPWNYPFQLTINPLIGAMAAGNLSLIKTSSKSEHTSNIIKKIISLTFDKNYISIIDGPGEKSVNYILDNFDIDHIFFTGSVEVGKSIMKKASEKLTPLTLELGGKSPALVLKDSNIELAAKRIVWGKFYNTGQTCIAPDYVLVDQSIEEKFIFYLKKYMEEFYSSSGQENIGRIINKEHFDRLVSYLDQGEVIYGGQHKRDKLFIQPSLILPYSLDSKLMTEEIFGPILAILTFTNLDEAISLIEKNPYPLALYLFTKDKDIQNFLINRIQFGGGCINNTINHFANSKLAFGGIRYSGMGSYHDRYSFDSFSHKKSILVSPDFEFDLKYPPYNMEKYKLVKKILK